MSGSEKNAQRTGLEIAIIGLDGRFPGAGNVEAFWQNLKDGIESISFFSDEELEAEGIDPALLRNPNFVKARGVLQDADLFDADFFSYNPRDAEIMDPQQRVFLECAWKALENAGYDSQMGHSRIGVYAGVSMNSYFLNLYSNPDLLEGLSHYQAFIANDKDFLATRVSYKMNLTGPSMVIQTACSTSLVAVHQACRALLGGECDMALAGGSSVILPQKSGHLYQEEGIMSPDGHCRAFDAQAQGTVGGNGVGIVVLKRLEDALADGDNIRAVIKGSAINNDGFSKVGFTAPGVDGQSEAIRSAHLMAEVDPETISYVEAHGTGTSLGDPIEIAALTAAFRSSTQKKNFCGIGSVKTNIGHLDVAAGVAGLIKTVLSLEQKQLAPSINFEQPNPAINFEESPFYVNTKLREWPAQVTPRRAAVSSFGLGGTNAHLVIEEAPQTRPSGESRPWQLLTLSARTASALGVAATNLARHLRANPDLNLADVAYTLKVGRRRFDNRLAVVCRDSSEAAAALENGQVMTDFREPVDSSVVFMFPGGGAQYANMGLDLYRDEPAFREHVDACLELLKPQLGFDLRSTLYPEPEQFEEAAKQLRKTSLALPALFITEYALARLWMSWGVQPEALIGHSLGEYVAACLAGVFSLEDALSLVVLRGRLFEQLPEGAMLNISLPKEEVRELIDDRLSIAAINGPASCVVSGPVNAIDEMTALLTAKDIEFRRLHIDVAAHSAMVTPILETFTEFLSTLHLREPEIPFISNVTGTWITGEEATSPSYWAKHLRQTVCFFDGLQELIKEPNRILLEVGPGQTLTMLAKAHAEETHSPVIALSSMRHPLEQRSDTDFLISTMAKLWLTGEQIDWRQFYAAELRRRVPLPTYPFEQQRYWVAPRKLGEFAAHQPSLEKRMDVAEWFYLPIWKRSVTPAQPQHEEQAGCWLIFVDEGELGFRMVTRLRQEGLDVVAVQIGNEFANENAQTYTVDPRRPTDYLALLEALRDDGKVPQTIVHFWSVTPSHQTPSFEEVQDTGYYSLLFLISALEATGIVSQDQTTNVIQLAVISNHLHAISANEESWSEKATLLGPCKVIPQEYLNTVCTTIDIEIPQHGTRQEARLIDQLLAEIKTRATGGSIAYRGSQRWIQSFEPLKLERSANDSVRWREKGVYLITGGMGGVGLLLASHLAQTVQARLVLVGRTSLPPRDEWQQWFYAHTEENNISRKMRQVQELEAAGAEVLLACADVSDEAQMLAVIQQTEARFGALHGVFHAAGITSGKSFCGPLKEIGRDVSEEQFRAKVYGTYALAKVIEGKELDFVLLFSSNAAVLGGLGFRAYAAANLFLDAFAARMSSSHTTRWISCNWDGWQLGEAESENTTVHTSMAQYAMTPKESIDALERILSSDMEGQVAVSAGSLPARLSLWIKRESLQGTSHAAKAEPSTPFHSRQNLRNTYVAPTNEVQQKVVDIWQSLIGSQMIGIHDNFFELGGHSLLATRIVTRLRDTFHIKLPIRLLFESPTVAGLSELIVAKLAEELDGDVLTSLEGLSPIEVGSLLAVDTAVS